MRPRRAVRAAFALLALVAFTGFVALGTWQLERRAWKHDLVARVDARVHAAPVPPPTRERWAQVGAARDEYRHVRVAGTFLHDRETLVQAVTALGSGFWVLTPLRTDDGTIVLVNRGFVPPEVRERAARRANETEGATGVTGLVRMTEPAGGFLRKNDPAGERWFSRDVAAIAAARGLADVAPYFIDAEDTSKGASPRTWPAGGQTVIAFADNHLVYALTWYALALMVAGAAWRLFRTRQDRGR